MKLVLVFFILSFFLIISCKTNKAGMSTPDGPAGELLAKTLDAHGGKRYASAAYEFVFRDKVYTFKNKDAEYAYTVLRKKEGQEMVDVLTNDGFTRSVDGQSVQLSEKEQKGYGAGLNSVIYFATLPYKLLDPAVNLSYVGTKKIKDDAYEILQVTFDKEGGGQDFDDQYYFWINATTSLIDYFAYNYRVSGGGVRFRAAYNPRTVGGIVFQDYINYKAPVGTALADLPGLYENEALKQLSVIATEKVRLLK